MARCVSVCCASIAVIIAVAIAGYRVVVLSPISFKPINLAGQVAIVTGATNGIGLETAVALASWNASVVLPVRNVAKGERVKKEILARLPQGSTGAITLMECDLASFSSVRKFVAAFIANGRDFQMLVLNAGMMDNNLRTTEDGVEQVYQVNHLSHFLMVRLLVDAPVKRAGPVRVVHVSSSMHYLGSLDEVAYSKENRNADTGTADLLNSYSTTKMMNIMFSNKLQRKLGPSAITSIAIHPGLVVSGLDSNLPPPFADFMLWLRKQIARNTDDGAVTQVTAATLPELSNAGGQYLEDRCIENLCKSCVFCNADGGVQPKNPALSIETQDWLWTTSSAIVGLGA